jgi:glycosyltransferase involved in cell wall biosynthesis
VTKNPEVSVLIPSYNHGRYVRETIASVCSQTVKNIEILILDDGSTDNSLAIIQQMAGADSRIRWWQQANAGLVPTLNRLAERARAPFVAQIDSDDVWTPQRLEWGLKDMAQDASLSVSFTSYLRITETGTPVPRADQLKLGHLDHAALLRRMAVKNTVCACTAFMRRSALQQIGSFARNYSLSHDWDRWLRLSLVGTMVKHDTIGAFYRQHDGNQSLDEQATRKQELAILDDLAETLISHHQLDLAKQVEIYGRAAALAYDTGQPERLVSYLLRKSKIYPLFEHEQIWLLYVILQQKKSFPQQVPSYGLKAHKNLFTPENQKRLDQIMAFMP